jgi:hypothetical protein
MIKYRLLLFFIGFICSISGFSQAKNASLVETFKASDRGPYKDIRWFCKDGTIKPAKEPCGDVIGGNQRARYRDEVVSLASREHIFLGQILAATDFTEFWDAKHDQSRFKQYLVEKYLEANDGGWIQQKSQFYRGAIQIEDEEEWGKEFFKDLFTKVKVTEDNFLVIREGMKTIPHGGDNPSLYRIRALSKEIAEEDTKFEDIRIKIHGNPNPKDTSLVAGYLASANGGSKSKAVQLLDAMHGYYDADVANIIVERLKKLASFAELKKELNEYAKLPDHLSKNAFIEGVGYLNKIKSKILVLNNPGDKIILFDISILIEQLVLNNPAIFDNPSKYEYIETACYLSQLTAATGYLNDWELEELMSGYTSRIGKMVSQARLEEVKLTIRKNINWSSSLFSVFFDETIQKFAAFEPLAPGFYDDRLRSSSILTLGRLEAEFSAHLDKIFNRSQSILGKKANGIQGLNPGIAQGKVYINTNEQEPIDKTGIYLFKKPPSDLEPVAGILSISEGNAVSHLQLLARNLGIPNATIDKEMYDKLSSLEGETIFYAVAANGNVIIKRANSMTNEESQLFSAKTLDEEVIEIPIDKVKLDVDSILNIRNLNSKSTGIYCGPKAANFAELKQHFPENLVEGLVIPFGVFKSHMLQIIPGKQISYWDYLVQIFEEEGDSRKKSEAEILSQLDTLRKLIAEMPLKKTFVSDLERSFKRILNKNLGDIPVFLRSDTNMEDLKDFTGAGLNLTVFNVQAKEKILQGIKDVWASPYVERSYKWRQKYLKNPEHVYPSILVIPSVFVDRSGVLISKQIQTGANDAVTVAMSRGVGGAVDGQSSETRILTFAGENILLVPSRDRTYKTLTPSDGTVQKACSLSKAIIEHDDVADIWKMMSTVYETMPGTGMKAPYDMEFGFVGDRLWIFQIRPFVENKRAGNLNYLQKLNGADASRKSNIALDESF